MRRRGIIVCAIAATLAIVTALPAAAWNFRYLGYPGNGYTVVSGSFAEGACSARGEGHAETSSVILMTPKVAGGGNCYMEVQAGYWAGDHVDWYGRHYSYSTAYTGGGSCSWHYYTSQHGVSDDY